MDPKEYLKQIRYLDECIRQKEIQLELMISRRTFLQGIDYSKERVQTSIDGGGFTEMSDKIADLYSEIEKEKDNYYKQRNEIINQIQKLENADHCEILHMRYAEFKSFEEIACLKYLSYDRIIHVHGEALKKFKEKYFTV